MHTSSSPRRTDVTVRRWPARWAALSLLATIAPADALTLNDANWNITIDPATLATQAQLGSTAPLPLSMAGPADQVQGLRQQGGQASWRLRDAAVLVEARLDGTVLTMRFQRDQPGAITYPRVPAGARGLLLPLSEGSYIPAQDANWHQALLRDYQDLDTTQGMGLPALGFDHGTRVLSLLFATPFNNQLHFEPSDAGIALTARHQFTRLDLGYYEVQFTLDGPDLLAPAKRYRAWLQAQGRFVPLKDKLAAAHDGARLIGASHAYLWGDAMLARQDVRAWPALKTALAGLPTWRRGFDADGRKALVAGDLAINRYLQRVLLANVNSAAQRLAPGADAASLDRRRTLIAAKLGGALIDPARWGDGLSVKMVEALRGAGLERLWLGVPEMQAGLAHPEAIAAARAAGYLIGPYDSYDTALPQQINPSWTTAHLGQDAYQHCGVMREDGKRQSGFKDNGVYTNPACIRPLLEQRVRAVQRDSNYNSWFLDVDATGMVFDDYDPAKPTSQQRDASNRIAGMDWVARTLGVVVGSEGGNAVANSAVAFGHGMETMGFGWHDPDMRERRASPYYLGRYYPADAPEWAFNQVSIKPVYRQRYFDPALRLPLFQAAFHDSVITTLHWETDILKFKEARRTSELLLQLYNVPPLLNLNLDSNSERLPYLKRLDAFFRPLHERLAYQALTGFEWRSADRLVQQTRFADGTRLLANFKSQPFHEGAHTLPPFSVTAFLPDGTTRLFQSR
ncbi:glycoside hydrolase [Duganella violaceipulchra]|uniref:Glycoside hydrolase n=1 Tax=Duganella violaceipulchra TaxID=2849652 RepID=A0AA41L5P8_9BURK|nr:glycoside hydrolase [Duganella violaceicalia]MBV6322467.1 glycoside hydrolase [Duganella violaceicalia]MCP2010672.1 hypothetical protein [Duganella violaceicalia]